MLGRRNGCRADEGPTCGSAGGSGGTRRGRLLGRPAFFGRSVGRRVWSAQVAQGRRVVGPAEGPPLAVAWLRAGASGDSNDLCRSLGFSHCFLKHFARLGAEKDGAVIFPSMYSGVHWSSQPAEPPSQSNSGGWLWAREDLVGTGRQGWWAAPPVAGWGVQQQHSTDSRLLRRRWRPQCNAKTVCYFVWASRTRLIIS